MVRPNLWSPWQGINALAFVHGAQRGALMPEYEHTSSRPRTRNCPNPNPTNPTKLGSRI
jgi:hypothetical protein